MDNVEKGDICTFNNLTGPCQDQLPIYMCIMIKCNQYANWKLKGKVICSHCGPLKGYNIG